MKIDARAACLQTPRGPVVISSLEADTPGPGEVQVRMEACGVCHSDVMITGLEKLPLAPLVLGHEGIGIVEAIGEGVTNVAPGDRVGITYLASSCGACDNCRGGRERFCLKQKNHGFTRHGVLATHASVAAQNLVRVPDSLSAAQLAPLSCAGWTAMGALREANVQPKQWVAIFGFGGLGHLAMHYAHHAGANVAVVDIGEGKLAFARELGADIAVEPDKVKATLGKELGGVDASLVFTPSAAAVPVAFSALKRCGSLILVGLTTDTYSFSVTETVLKGIRVQGSYLGTRDDLEKVFALAAEGVAKPTVTEYPLDATPDLIARLHQGQLKGRAVISF
ncbi:MAG: zinc-dependent alcohol dehydrogenase [Acidobacteria bacterium]|nr:zinc-dependent alcohol dehydrogenase [Acidobacteriota bacterium]